MKNFTTNWKTTLGGALTAALGMITGGVGLIFAKDGNVTGGAVRQ